jgi:hypothetical protein
MSAFAGALPLHALGSVLRAAVARERLRDAMRTARGGTASGLLVASGARR